MGKFLVVYYSFTGTSRLLAKALSEFQSWPLAEVQDLEPRLGWTGNMRCVLDSLLRRQPDICFPEQDLKAYDLVILIAPIWSFRLASPMRSFVSRYRDQLPDVAVISVTGAYTCGASNSSAEIGYLLGRAPISSMVFNPHEIENGIFSNRVNAFGKALRQAQWKGPAVSPTAWAEGVTHVEDADCRGWVRPCTTSH